MLVLEAIAYAHPGRAAYRFDLTVAPGEIVGISGRSGAGKSTLLDLIAGFLSPMSGTMALDGTDLVPLPPERRPVSILLQSELLFEHLSAGRNVALGLPSRLPRTERDAKVAAALAEVGLAGMAPQRAGTLSGGQKQRVALARTLLRDRPILLLDEPFAALDPQTRTEARALVKALTRSRGWHTILVSHDPEDISALAARHLALADGHLVAAP